MAYGRSSYPDGNSATVVGGNPYDQNPTNMLKALLHREATAPRPMAPVAAQPQAAPMASMKRAGGGSRPRMTRTAGDGARALMRGPSRPEGRHSFVTNIKGGPQVMGGLVSSGSGPGAVYGGWQVDEAPGPVHFANLPSADGPIFGEAEDPAARALALNSALGPSRAEIEMRERLLRGR